MARINSDKFRSLRRLYGGLRVLTLLAGGLLAMLALSMLASRQPEVQGTGELLSPPTAAAGAAQTREPASLASPVPVFAPRLREASGIAWHSVLGHMFVVGDEGTLTELEPTGRVVTAHRVKGDLEDVTVHGPTGRLVLLAEKKGELVVWDPATLSETARFTLDVAGILGKQPDDRNLGFEGLTFRQEDGLQGGGTFYILHQKKPARLVALAFDPAGAARTLGAADVVARHTLKPYEDLTAVTWSEPLSRLLVIARSDDRLLVVSPAGTITRAYPLVGTRQEGLALDPEGALWVADERLGLFRIPGALAALVSDAEAGS